MFARVIQAQLTSGMPEEQGTAFWQERLLPIARNLHGFRGIQAMSDGAEALLLMYFDTEEDAKAVSTNSEWQQTVPQHAAPFLASQPKLAVMRVDIDERR